MNSLAPLPRQGTRTAPGQLTVRPISPAEHAAVAAARSASFLQTPQWAAAKPGWRSESLGWFDGEDDLVGIALVLYRPVPGSRRSLAYAPEGPVLPWAHVVDDPARWLTPFVAHLRRRGAFAVRIGPPVPLREWRAPTAKRGLADARIGALGDLPPDVVHPDGAGLVDGLRRLGWQPADGDGGGFGAGQPRFTVRLPLDRRTPAELLAGTNQQWRRNVARSTREGVGVREGNADDLPSFHALYRETAERDGFTPRPEAYFTRMWAALLTDPGTRPRLYLGELAGEGALAAALTVQVGSVNCYVYGASTSRRREAQASTAVQWRAITDAAAAGCAVHDLRGIGDTLDPQAPLAGLVRFKLATGATCVQGAGEWELVLSRVWHTAFRGYLRWRP